MQDELHAKMYDHIMKWGVVEVLLPTALVVAVYFPIGIFSLNMPDHLFVRVFSSADFLPLSSLILLGTFVDVEHDRTFESLRDERIEGLRYACLVFAFLFMLCYGSLKLNYLSYSFPPANQPVHRNIELIGYLAIASAALAIPVSFWAKLRSIRLKLQRTQEALRCPQS